MQFTQSQITEILSGLASDPDGLNQILQCSLEALMNSERDLHNENKSDVSNGYRSRKANGFGQRLELQVPRSRYNQFYPVILGLLKNQEEEAKRIAYSLYGAGLTTAQVGELFGEFYGNEYSTSQVSRMFDTARDDVQEWLCRPLESYYPIVMIDATFISTRRGDSVSKEAYYTILGVKPDLTREVLSIVNLPTESPTGWMEVFKELKERGVKDIDLIVTDASTGIETAISKEYRSKIQFCTVHLKRNVLNNVKREDKATISDELRDIFRTNDSSFTKEQAWVLWTIFCNKYGKKYPKLKRMNNERYMYYFNYLKYDYRVRSMIYTTNWVERLNRDYKRTTKMRGSLPNPDATMLLLGYVAMNKKAYDHKVVALKYETSFKWEI